MILRMNEDPPSANDLSQVFLPPLESLGPSPRPIAAAFKEEDSNDFPISSHPGLGKEIEFDELCSFQNNYTVPDSQVSGKRKRSLSPVQHVANENNFEINLKVDVVKEAIPPPITLIFDDFSEDSIQEYKEPYYVMESLTNNLNPNSNNQILPSALSQFKKIKLQMISNTTEVAEELVAETQPLLNFKGNISQAIDSQDEDVQRLWESTAMRISAESIVDKAKNNEEMIELEEFGRSLNGIAKVEDTPTKPIENVVAVLVKESPLIFDEIDNDQRANELEKIDIPENSGFEGKESIVGQLAPDLNIDKSLAHESVDPLILPESFFGTQADDMRETESIVVKRLENGNEKEKSKYLRPETKAQTVFIDGKDASHLVLRESDNFNSASVNSSQQILPESHTSHNNGLELDKDMDIDIEEVKSSMPATVSKVVEGEMEFESATFSAHQENAELANSMAPQKVESLISAPLAIDAQNDKVMGLKSPRPTKEDKSHDDIKLNSLMQSTAQPNLSLDLFREESDISLTQDADVTRNINNAQAMSKMSQLNGSDDISRPANDDNVSVELNVEEMVEDSQQHVSQAASEFLVPLRIQNNLETVPTSHISVPIATPEPSPRKTEKNCDEKVQSVEPVSADPSNSQGASVVPPVNQEISSKISGPNLSSKLPPRLDNPSPLGKPKKHASKSALTRKIDFAAEARSSSPRRTRQKSIPSYAESETSSAFENDNDEDYEMTQKETIESPIKVKLESRSKTKKHSTPKSILKNSVKQMARNNGYSTAQDSSPCMDRKSMVTFKKSITIKEKEKLKLFGNFKFVLTVSKKDATPDLPEKGKLIQLIESLDGEKLDNFSSVFDKRNRRQDRNGESSSIVILIAYVPVRTHKYLMALALGVPVVSAAWVLDCKRDSRLHPFNRYLLENGHSVLEDKLISPRASVNGIFEGKSFYILASTESAGLVNDWKEVLISCGASIVTKKRGRSDYALCIGTISTKVFGNLESGIIVAYPWVIACLIHQSLLDPALHDSFTAIE